MSSHPWNDPAICQQQRLMAHAPWAAFADAETARTANAGSSPWMRLLSGTWDFALFPCPEAVPPSACAISSPDIYWSPMPVPSNWQLHGVDQPIYRNIEYPFQARPPLPPDKNPTGLYRRNFDLPPEWNGRRTILHLGSADASAHVWVNGTFCGYGEDSKLPSEFDISEFLVQGRNVVAILVPRFCSGSWLEKQDYWHLSGLQRDVWLISKPLVAIRDWCVQTTGDELTIRTWMTPLPELPSYDGNGAILFAASTWQIELHVFAPDGTPVSGFPKRIPFANQSPMYGDTSDEAFAARLVITIPGAPRWTAETPHLHTLVLSLIAPDGTVVDHERCRFGFRTITISDGILRLDGRRLIVRGVNRHEFNPIRGRAVSEADMRADILAMKRLNFNAVRTCHYPNDSRFYALCDELGLYVIDEANLETHGAYALFSKDPTWAGAYLQRAIRMLLRDRNHPCIIAWSLGNESSYGPHHAAMAAWIRHADPTRPVQYESGNPPATITDIMAPMYADLAWVRSELQKPHEHRPLIMCEYAYGKGNSTGNVDEFWALVEELPRFQGGFMWDWADKALWIGGKLIYGTPSHEPAGVERMCLNGIVSHDLRPWPGAWELKHVQSPVQLTIIDSAKGLIRIANRHLVLGTDHLTLAWNISASGITLAQGTTPCPAVKTAADQDFHLTMPHAKSSEPGSEILLHVSVTLTNTSPWADAGHVLTQAQAIMAWPISSATTQNLIPSSAITITTAESSLIVHSQRTSLTIHRAGGHWSRLVHEGVELLAAPVEPCFYRAPTDIDRANGKNGIAATWQQCGLDSLITTATHVHGSVESGIAHIHVDTVSTKLDTVCARRSLLTYHENGDIDVHETIDTKAITPSLPRIGLRLAMPITFSQITWFGRGPHESYADRQTSAMVGRYTTTVDQMMEPRIFPQESGARTDLRWFAIRDHAGYGLLIQGRPRFTASALPYSLEELANAAHRDLLPPSSATWIHLDGFLMGVGGDTGWTINVHPPYRILPGQHQWGCRIRPLSPGDDVDALGRRWITEATV